MESLARTSVFLSMFLVVIGVVNIFVIVGAAIEYRWLGKRSILNARSRNDWILFRSKITSGLILGLVFALAGYLLGMAGSITLESINFHPNERYQEHVGRDIYEFYAVSLDSFGTNLALATLVIVEFLIILIIFLDERRVSYDYEGLEAELMRGLLQPAQLDPRFTQAVLDEAEKNYRKESRKYNNIWVFKLNKFYLLFTIVNCLGIGALFGINLVLFGLVKIPVFIFLLVLNLIPPFCAALQFWGAKYSTRSNNLRILQSDSSRTYVQLRLQEGLDMQSSI